MRPQFLRVKHTDEARRVGHPVYNSMYSTLAQKTKELRRGATSCLA